MYISSVVLIHIVVAEEACGGVLVVHRRHVFVHARLRALEWCPVRYLRPGSVAREAEVDGVLVFFTCEHCVFLSATALWTRLEKQGII